MSQLKLVLATALMLSGVSQGADRPGENKPKVKPNVVVLEVVDHDKKEITTYEIDAKDVNIKDIEIARENMLKGNNDASEKLTKETIDALPKLSKKEIGKRSMNAVSDNIAKDSKRIKSQASCGWYGWRGCGWGYRSCYYGGCGGYGYGYGAYYGSVGYYGMGGGYYYGGYGYPYGYGYGLGYAYGGYVGGVSCGWYY